MLPLLGKAQLESSHWFFNGSRQLVRPSGVSGSVVNNSLDVIRSSTSVADKDGNLLFASDGEKLVDRDMVVMPGLGGKRLGAMNKILIHQIPGSQRYYFFYSTPNSQVGFDTARWTLKYAIIDMTLRAGKGDVVVFDQVIETRMSPSFTIIDADRFDDVWLVTHVSQTDSFYNYKISTSGLSLTPVKSKAGSNIVLEDYIYFDLKSSYDGKTIAGITYRNYSVDFARVYWLLEIFDFDPAAGTMVSRIRTPRFFTYFHTFLTIEFSPDSRLVYTSMIQQIDGLQPCGFGNGELRQYQLCYSDTNSFYDNSYLIDKRFERCAFRVTWGKLVLGADKQIHIPHATSVVSLIRFPNRYGAACGYIFNGYSIPNTNAGVGTPQFNPTVIRKAVQNNIIYDGSCFPSPYKFGMTNKKARIIEWDFGDPASSTNTSAVPEPLHYFSLPGKYIVRLKFEENGIADELIDTVVVSDPGGRLLSGYPQDTVLCGVSGLWLKPKQAGQGLLKWYMKTADGIPYNLAIADSVFVSESGKWYVEVSPQGCNGCRKLDSIGAVIAKSDLVELGPDRILCSGDSVIVSLPVSPLVRYTWNDGSSAAVKVFKNDGLYYVNATFSDVSCTYADTVRIRTVLVPVVKLPEDTTLCLQQKIQLSPSIRDVDFLWSNQSRDSTFLVDQPGTVWVRITDRNGCVSSDTILVKLHTPPVFDLGRDTTLCEGQNISIGFVIARATYTWNTTETSAFINVKTEGQYKRVVSVDGCSYADSIRIGFLKIPFLDLGSDTTICSGESLVLRSGLRGGVFRWQDGSMDSVYLVKQAGQYWLEYSIGACSVRDSMSVVVNPTNPLYIGADTVLCEGDRLYLNAGSGFQRYRWSTGEVTSSVYVNAVGKYSVTATNQFGCDSKDTIAILNKFQKPVPDIGQQSGICRNETLILSPGMFSTYLWNNGSRNSSLVVKDTGLYWVEVANSNGCTARDSVRLNRFIEPPKDFLFSDTVVCRYEKIILQPLRSFQSYKWSTGSLDPSLSVSEPGVYVLSVKDISGCFGMDTIVVKPKECRVGVFVPNAFTPGNDGKNDTFRPLIFAEIESMNFTIFNRFGEIVFRTVYQSESWNGNFQGQPSPSGTYTWFLQYKLKGEDAKQMKGTVTVIR
jgi:gliding motility-associated-like protein